MDTGVLNDFKELFRLLNAHGVKYLVVGGYAVNYYGHHRFTQDLDVWLESTLPNGERFVEVMNAFIGPDPDLKPESITIFDKIIRMGRSPYLLEFFTHIPGVDFQECYEKRTIADWGDVEVSLISRDKLKDSKRATGRFKDLDDIDHLE